MSCDFEPFRAHLVSIGRSDRTVAGYLFDIKTFAAWFEQTNGYPLAPDNLTPTDVREYRQYLLIVQKAKASTINRQLAGLRAYGLWGKSSGQIDLPPKTGPKKQVVTWVKNRIS